jgi:hypothetical protein
MRIIAAIILSLTAVAYASAAYAALGPRGVHLDSCLDMSGYSSCQLERTHAGPAVQGPLHADI